MSRRIGNAWAAALWVSVLGLAVVGPIDRCRAQPAPPVRLPQDAARDLEPVPRQTPLEIDSDRFAEQAPPGADGVRFRLDAIELVGNSALPTTRFEALWAGLVGQEIALSAVFDVAARISAAYRDAGYVLSQALVPRQKIAESGGRVRIRVVEGFIGRITVAEDVAGADHIRAILEPLRAERPITLASLERRLMLLNDLPGLRARASLRSGQEEGAADIELAIERDLTAGSVALHNRTTTAVGPLRIEAGVTRRAVFGAFDEHSLRWIGSGTERLNLVAYNGDAPVGTNGAVLSWSASASRSKPRAGELFRFDTRAENASLGLSYPVLRSRDRNLSVRAAFAGYDGKSDILDGVPSSRERIRSLRTGLTADLTDAIGGVNLVDVEVAKGLSVLGASRSDDPRLARLGSDPQFTKLTLYAARLQSLGGEWSLLAAVTGQATDDILTSSEQFGLGGDAFLRAYDPSELLGDSGAAGKLELRYNLAVSALSATLYTFYEGGSVRLRSAGGPTTHQSALSGGIGARISGPHGLKGFIELAKPWHLATVRNGDESARVFAGVGIDF